MATYTAAAAVSRSLKFFLKDSPLISRQICRLSSSFSGKGRRLCANVQRLTSPGNVSDCISSI